MCADTAPEATSLPQFTTTVLPSNGQLLVQETAELLEAGVAAVRIDLAKTPAWNGAPVPTDDFLLKFLRAEVFSPAKAANRYRKFWQVKVFLCGEDKAALPIKVQDCARGLDKRFMQLVPGSRDVEGRQVMLIDVRNNDKSLDLRERVRAVWYVMLAALEDVETQRKGVCMLASLKTARITQMDPRFDKTIIDSIQGALPVRIGSMNLLYPPSFFRIAWGIISKFMNERLKQRVRVVAGADSAQVLNKLQVLVPPESVPPPMGTKTIDFEAWLTERVRSEKN